MATAANTQSQPKNHPAYKLLRNVYSDVNSSAIFVDKVRNKPLLLAPSHQSISHRDTAQILASKDKSKRALRRHIRLRKKQYYIQHQKPRPLSAKEKRELKIYDLAPEEIRYEVYRGLNRLWTGYVLEVLGMTTATSEPTSSTKETFLVKSQTSASPSSKPKTQSINQSPSSTSLPLPKHQRSPKLSHQRTISPSSHGSLLATLDYHGMNIHVTQSADVSRVGLKGIIVRETRSTFVMVTPKDKVTTIPKKGSIFRVVVDLDTPTYNPTTTTIITTNTTSLPSSGKEAKEAHDNDEPEGEETKKNQNDGEIDDNENETLTGRRKLVFELNGSQLEVRPFERAVKKFKWKRM